jgi:hypothetical protein
MSFLYIKRNYGTPLFAQKYKPGGIGIAFHLESAVIDNTRIYLGDTERKEFHK